MHDMIEKMEEVYENATAAMHSQMAGALGGGLSDEQRKQKAALQDPLKDMQDEIARLQKFLSHGEVRPDIAGWQPPSGAPSRSQPSSPSARSPPRGASPGPGRSQPRAPQRGAATRRV